MSGLAGQTLMLSGGALAERPAEGQLSEIVGWDRRTPQARIAFMREIVAEYRKDPQLAVFTMNQVVKPAGVPPREYQRQAQAILRWVQQRIYYVNEPDERLQTPWATLRWRIGDCDDVSLLVATMAESIGLASRFVLAGPDRRTGRLARWVEGNGYPSPTVDWGHVYVMIGWPALNPQHWAAAEPSMQDAPLGYDVTQHGVVGDEHGRIRVPRPGESPRGGPMPEFRRNGPPIGAIRFAAPDPGSPTPTSGDFWRRALSLALEQVPGVIVASIVSFYVTQWLDKRHTARPRRRRAA